MEGRHFAERCHLFIIIALGESLLVTGATFAETEASTANIAALVVAFLSSVALWWIYFQRSAEAARERCLGCRLPLALAAPFALDDWR